MKTLFAAAAVAMLAAGAAFAQAGNPTTMEPGVPGDPVLRGQSTDPIWGPNGPGNAWLRQNSVYQGVSSNEIFDAHDTNGDGVLDKDEFGRAHHFNPAFDCVGADATFDDPRCARVRATRRN